MAIELLQGRDSHGGDAGGIIDHNGVLMFGGSSDQQFTQSFDGFLRDDLFYVGIGAVEQVFDFVLVSFE